MALLEAIQQVAKHPIGEAEALPFGSYHSPEVYAAEQASMFSRDWVFVCFEADLPTPGDYQTLTLAGEPIAVVRGQDGELRALSNVCRHRGAVLLTGSGNLDTHKISCPYHAWTYSDEGSLKGVPYPGSVKVNKDAHCLPHFKLASMLGLVFVCLNDDVPPLQERFKGLEKYYSSYEVDSFRYTSGIVSEHWQANWKLAMENFLEGYHFFAVHKQTVEQAAPTNKVYYVEGHADWSITGGKQKDYARTLLGMIQGKEEEVEYLTICMPPNFVALLYEDYISWVRALPTGPVTCEVTFGTVSRHPYQASKSELSFSEKFFTEDREICERVQQGMSSQRSKGGQLVELERAVVDFHQYLAKQMFGEDYSEFYRNNER